MSNYICVTCGVQFADSGAHPPAHCPVCEDQRQFIAPGGQRWTTLEALRESHHNEFRRHEDRLVGVGTTPLFAIGQRALLVLAPEGNVLWDCISLIDEFTEVTVKALGGISAIAISHPHYYSSLAEWGEAFDAPVYLHASDSQWVGRPSRSVVHWEGDRLELHSGMSLVRAGGHFAGGTMLHAPFLAGGRGALLTSDVIQVIPDRSHVAFMYSYPNLIPLPAAAVQRIAETAGSLDFDRIYGAWWDRLIPSDAAGIVARSAERYARAVGAGLEREDGGASRGHPAASANAAGR